MMNTAAVIDRKCEWIAPILFSEHDPLMNSLRITADIIILMRFGTGVLSDKRRGRNETND